MHLEYDYPIVALMTITLQTSPMDKDTLFKGTKIHQIKVQRNTKSRTKIHQNALFCFYHDKDWSITQIVIFQPKYSKITQKPFVPLSLASSSPSITHFINLQSHLDLPSPTLPFPPNIPCISPSPNCTADRRMTVFARLILIMFQELLWNIWKY